MEREMTATELISSSLFFCTVSVFMNYNKARDINYIERANAYALQISWRKMELSLLTGMR
jgi:hypothetical protein